MPIKFRGGTELIDAVRFLEQGGVTEGAVVAELGCGTSGHFVFPAAHLTGPQGKVYAVDILKSVLEAVKSRGKLEGVDNVETVWADLERRGGLNIAPGSVDLVLALHILGQVKEKEILLSEAARVLKQGGILLVADWKKTASPLGPPVEKRIDPAIVKELVNKAGFDMTNEFGVGLYHFGIKFKKS